MMCDTPGKWQGIMWFRQEDELRNSIYYFAMTPLCFRGSRVKQLWTETKHHCLNLVETKHVKCSMCESKCSMGLVSYHCRDVLALNCQSNRCGSFFSSCSGFIENVRSFIRDALEEPITVTSSFAVKARRDRSYFQAIVWSHIGE